MVRQRKAAGKLLHLIRSSTSAGAGMLSLTVDAETAIKQPCSAVSRSFQHGPEM
jgi:hypothetical protein